MKYVTERIDWSRRADYVRTRHQVEPSWATEAANDPVAYWRNPDPASVSGRSARVIGYSGSADAVLTVILVPADTDADDQADGDWWGVNAWPANARDTRIYQEAQP